MGVSISIKNVPAELVERLKQRAKANHRSLQGELMAMIDAMTRDKPRKLTIDEILENVRRVGLKTPNESTKWIREDRDSR